jgi:lipopolysaccharide export system permease protein
MKILILNKYIGTTMIKAIGIIILALLSLKIFITLSSEISDIGNGNYGIMHALVYVMLLLPTDIYQFFPMAGLLGSLLGLGLLASHSELIVMRAAGVSLISITRVVMISSGIILIIAIIFGEIIGPNTQRIATKYKADALSKGQTLRTNKGTWVRNQRDFIHIEAIPSYGHLENITRYQFDIDNNLITSSFAARADYQNGTWIFGNITESRLNKQQITTAYHGMQDWSFSVDPRLLGTTEIETNQKTLPQLHSHINYLRSNNLNANRYEFAMWQRFFQPLAALVMILLAVPFIFGPLRSATMGLRMLSGAVVGLGFYMLNQFSGPISMVYEFPAFFAAGLPTLVMAGFGTFLLVRAK